MNEAVLDVLADALCLCMALQMMGRRVCAQRVAAAAVLGAGLAWLARQAGWTSRLLLWPVTAWIMARVAFASGRDALRGAWLLLAAEGLLGGTIQALSGATGSLWTAWIIGALAVGGMALSVCRARQTTRSVRRVRVSCVVRGKRASFEAMVDSGNCLRDYLTHRAVIVLPEKAARAWFELGDMPLRPIFADTAGGRQMMGCLAPESTNVAVEGRSIGVKCVLALSPALSPDAPALLPQSLLDSDEIEGSNQEGDAYGKAEG